MNKTSARLISGIMACLTGSGGAIAGGYYSNGSIINGGVNLSVISPPNDVLGYGSATGQFVQLADDFHISLFADFDGFDLVAYQDNSVSFTFTQVSWSVRKGTDVNTAEEVAEGTDSVSNSGLVGYRVVASQLGSQTRPVYMMRVDTDDFTISSGQHWLTWSITGSIQGGSFVPQVMEGIHPRPGNAQISLADSQFTPLNWGQNPSNTTELPFGVDFWVPEAPILATSSIAMISFLSFKRRR